MKRLSGLVMGYSLLSSTSVSEFLALMERLHIPYFFLKIWERSKRYPKNRSIAKAKEKRIQARVEWEKSYKKISWTKRTPCYLARSSDFWAQKDLPLRPTDYERPFSHI
ncbi:hypothetical protein [uncultured Sphaerochaeta sp.]|uniref:hypothetical protein n=1 Tax=uncultured Sphaerochaeta sp. TaxID=886478 RepID=UPI002A0A5501|nr:hypothetical protein [uncultured Sphaerochaeta sp.]